MWCNINPKPTASPNISQPCNTLRLHALPLLCHEHSAEALKSKNPTKPEPQTPKISKAPQTLNTMRLTSPTTLCEVSQNRGTPIFTPKYYNPYYGDPQKIPLILGNPQVWTVQTSTWTASTSQASGQGVLTKKGSFWGP